MTRSHSRAAQAACQDLLRLHAEDKAAELVGTIEERVRGGRSYLYDKFPRWRERIEASLARLPDTAMILRALA
jgi:hypothetical protein